MPASDYSWSAGGLWSDWVPVLSAAGGGLNLGASPTQIGRYTRIGNTVIGWGTVIFGASGVAAGTGSYQLTLPIAGRGASVALVMGFGLLRDSSTGNKYNRILNLDTTGAFAFFRNNADGGTAGVDNANPMTWAASDSIDYSFHYEIA